MFYCSLECCHIENLLDIGTTKYTTASVIKVALIDTCIRETSVVPDFKSTRFFIIFIPKICSVSSLKAQIKDSDYREPSEYSSKKIYFESHHLAAVWLFLYVWIFPLFLSLSDQHWNAVRLPAGNKFALCRRKNKRQLTIGNYLEVKCSKK